VRVLLGIASLLAAIAYAGLLLILITIALPGDRGDIVMLYPLLYFAVCVWTAFMGRRSTLLLVVGGVANLLLIALAIFLTRAGPDGWIFLLPTILFVLLWGATYLTLNERAEPPKPNTHDLHTRG
jgi:hypothetical protein